MIVLLAHAIPILPNQRLHWAKKRKLNAPIAEAIGWQAKASLLAGQAPIDRCRIRLDYTFTRRTRPLPDRDNLVAAAKPLIDAVVGAGLIVDDGPAHVLEVRADVRYDAARCCALWIYREGEPWPADP